ncbi:M48 family metallopeptidase [Nitrogeniibacter aestuarii]|uniref:M48 family metallopeptidase n=1 Tax=Nitrogeniibacter aestuarii TaxID=2815343 RepID=UPI001D0F52B2|nr:M48 family metallopeptidase [Nitrogeniibacter aestuarii]
MAGQASVEGRLFDGQSSRPTPVRLTVTGTGVDVVWLDGSDARERYVLDALSWHEPLGATRRLDLPDGRVCEVPKGAALSQFLAACGHRERAITVWQGSGLRVLIALMVLAVVGFAGYRWGVPLAAKWIAQALPDSAVEMIDKQFMVSLDKIDFLKPTQLSDEQQADLRAAIAPLMAARERQIPVTLHFRSAPQVGANAFALPGGTVVVTDELVKLAQTPEHVAAVVAHELGHVRHRHGLRNVVQASILAAVVTVWTGDASALATAGASVLLNSAYSRDFEREADDYGADLLKKTHQSPMLLAEMLDALTRQAIEEGDLTEDEADGHWSDYVASHPPTPERIERLRRASEQ